jgi:hypothetical protein
MSTVLKHPNEYVFEEVNIMHSAMTSWIGASKDDNQ